MKKKKISKKKQDNTIRNIFIILIAIIVLFFAGFFYQNLKKEVFDINKAVYYKYEGFDFYRDGSYWLTNVQYKGELYNVRVAYSPIEVYSVNVIYGKNHRFTELTAQGKPIYLALDPESKNLSHVSIAMSNMAYPLSKVFGLKVITSCTKNTTECSQRPIVNCSPNIDGIVIIFNNTDEESYMMYTDNCVFVNGKNEELDRISSRAVLEWLQILKIDEKTGQIIRYNITDFRLI